MKIGYTTSPGAGDTDLLLSELARGLIADGLKVCGVAQINTDREKCHACDMDVKVLPDGPVIRISQDLGPEARGCRLDPDALETAVAEVATRLHEGIDVLILNKFGKHEADGRGFRNLIGEALAMDVPVITGLNTMNKPAFEAFCEGSAEHIAADINTLRQWLLSGAEPDAQVA